MSDFAIVEVTPGRIGRAAIERDMRLATESFRSSSENFAAIVVDEEGSAYAALTDVIHEFGIALFPRWDDSILTDPLGVALAWTLGAYEAPRSARPAHIAETLELFANAPRRIVVVLNPLAGSPAMTAASRAGVAVIGLVRRNTVVPNVGTILAWRRAADLQPLLLAIKPSNFEQWREAYVKADAVVYSALRESPPVDAGPREIAPNARKLVVHRGGRVPLYSFKTRANSIHRALEALGIEFPIENDPDEWVVGGRMVGANRALQVTRTIDPDLFDVQLVWSSADPTPSFLIDTETEVKSAMGGS